MTPEQTLHKYRDLVVVNSDKTALEISVAFKNLPEPQQKPHFGGSYASGFTSAFMGRFILFKEVECAATGRNQCRIVGKPVEEWPDAHELTPYYEADSILNCMLELRGQVDALRASIQSCRQPQNLIGSSPGFRRAYSLIDKAAVTQVTVLLLGETGVGKERFARALHDMSRRSANPFVAVNCAALPGELIDAIVTERGVCRPPYTESLAALFSGGDDHEEGPV